MNEEQQPQSQVAQPETPAGETSPAAQEMPSAVTPQTRVGGHKVGLALELEQ
ncbi:hypothetical protein SAMN05216188_11936 [Lentzea xinjiangensis]|uniref:Uncharacterized protein n=1 Tax=Lentzea xinjiangensis TaxID=402600 RepID=A0A1H9TSJ2_9PSEU|nr:hypothetical protein SAMN05216188_11936 [Lentzea xinjiangensis]